MTSKVNLIVLYACLFCLLLVNSASVHKAQTTANVTTSGPINCKTTQLGQEYVGKKQHTRSGLLCQKWASDYPHSHVNHHGRQFPDGSQVAASNYCRNPDQGSEGPWCYTMDPDVRFEYCDIPFCDEEVDSDDRVEIKDAETLLEELFSKYDPRVRPGEGKFNSTLNVEFGASLTRIRKLNEEDETLDAVFSFVLEWTDPRLAWDLEKYEIDILRVPGYMIWKPDLMIDNGVQGSQGAINLQADVNAVIYSDGSITYVVPLATKTFCNINKSSDVQICTIKIGSWTYEGHSVDLTIDPDHEVSLEEYYPSSKWTVDEARLVRNLKKYDCCEEPYVDVTITLKIRRNN